MVFNEMLWDTDVLRMSAFTIGVSTLDFNQTAAVLNTNGLLFKLYGDHMGAGLLPVPYQEVRLSPRRGIRRGATSQAPTPAARRIRSTWWLR